MGSTKIPFRVLAAAALILLIEFYTLGGEGWSPLPASPPEGIQVCCSLQAWVLKRHTSWVPASQAYAHTWCFGCLLGLLHPHQLGACVLGVGSRGQVRWGHLSCPCPFQGSEEEEGGPQPWLPWQRGGSLVSGGRWQPRGHRVSPPSQGPGPGAPGTQGFQCQLEALLPTFMAWILAELTAAFAQAGSPPARDLSRGKAG